MDSDRTIYAIFIYRATRLMKMNIDTNREPARLPMKRNSMLFLALVIVVAGCGLALFLSPASRPHLRMISRPVQAAVVSDWEAPQTRAANAPGANEFVVDPGFGADVEQSSSSTRYTIHVRQASGAEQSIPVTAPPGGLQFEIRDMTGDGVQNDLIVTPTLLPEPLMVLVNDGHDHFTVGISSVPPDSLDSSRGQASAAQHVRELVALVSSTSKAGSLATSSRPFVPQSQVTYISSNTQTVTNRSGSTFPSGRAPPALATQI
jgi:hypothetical protein